MSSSRHKRAELAVWAWLGLIACLAGVGSAGAAEDGVILMYHHVDTHTPKATSVTPERFRAHLRYLEDHDFNVVPLVDVLEGVSGRSLPERAIAITFDDGYESVLTQALAELRARDWPFTVFVSTDPVDRGYGGYLSWEQLRELTRHGATIGNHTRTHSHLVRRRDDETDTAWRARVREEIVSAGRRIAEELGDAAVDVLAYPYGEYDDAVLEIAAELDLFGVGQHSGAVGATSDLRAAPRYPLATGFDSDEDFAVRVRSRALPARAIGEVPRIVARPGGRPTLALELEPGDYRIEQLACFATGQGRIEVEHLDDDPYRIDARPTRGLGPGRTKINCTAPSAGESGVFYWFGHQIMTRAADGTWYRE